MGYYQDYTDTVVQYDRYGSDSGSWIHVFSITFTSVIPSPDGTYQSFTAYPRIGDFYDKTIGYTSHNVPIIVAPKMLCTIRMNWSWHGGAGATFVGYGPFEQQPTTVWKIYGWGKIAGCGDPYDPNGACTNMSFAIPLDDVKSINIGFSY
jgi:hypothetical protein